jgi:putative transposase
VSLASSCQLLGISRQAVYQRQLRQQQRKVLLEPVKGIVLDLRRYMPRLGTRKLYFLLKPKLEQLGIKIGRDGLFDYLRKNNLLIKSKRSYTKTTYSRHWMKKHPNLFQDGTACLD